ncbi:hypothetical protein PRK78_000489 [Emydomyces testavorans]|uniref:JmjC domain-containing protein n=1 Tax=Emydomyces testavorans TaxID=2070801 RepID=A0AAF0IFX0_9EURO|nr:hypothetical protein PRK78_000489 [Emydomyces testavorans]
MHSTLHQRSDFNVLKGGQEVDLAELEEGISTALYQAMLPLDGQDGSDKYSLMNIWLPKEYQQLHPNQALESQLRIAPYESLPLGMNFAPAQTFVDLHIDQNRHALSQSIGASCHIWLLYPPTEQNLEVFTELSGESGHLTKASGQLEEGYVAKIDASMVLYMPPAWIHGTFTTVSGGLVGVNFKSLDGLNEMAQSLAAHAPYMFQLKETFNDDLEVYQETIQDFLDDEYATSVIKPVIES